MHSSSLAAGAAVFAVAVLGSVPAMADSPAKDTSGTPMCAASQLTGALGGSDAGAGNLYRFLVLTNSGSTTCHLTGYPGVSMLDTSGKQIGQPATRQSMTYAAIVLRPGASASDTIHTINHQGTCLPASSKLKVYPPGNTASLVVAGAVTNCDNLFSVTPLAAGKDGNPSSGSAPTPTPVPSTSAPSGATGGQQVPTVPQGAPDTGLAATGSHGGNNTALEATGAAALVLGGAAVAVVRRRRVRAER
jgi:hypothetical protein